MTVQNDEAAVVDVVKITDLDVHAYTIPTETPEADGTLDWSGTTLILTTICAGDKCGIGYTYGDPSIVYLIQRRLKPFVLDQNAFNIPAISHNLKHQLRNEGYCGLSAMAVSAIDTALWDLKAKLLGLPLASLFGSIRDSALVYGSGGFTNYTSKQLHEQLSRWSGKGFTYIKMKIGRNASADKTRVRVARESLSDSCRLMVDANGAYDAKTAISQAYYFEKYDVVWFEEPVSSDDLEALKFIRSKVPPAINVAAGEYGYTSKYFKKLLQHRAVDVLQADATRCGGFTGFIQAAFLAEAFAIPLSFHCAPALHLHVALSVPNFFIGEYFFDHARIESMLFEGSATPENGKLKADLTQPGMGLTFKSRDAEKYKVL